LLLKSTCPHAIIRANEAVFVPVFSVCFQAAEHRSPRHTPITTSVSPEFQNGMDTSDFRNGLSIIYDNDIYTIVDFQHVKPGKGGAFVRSKLKNLRTGSTIDKTWRAGEKMDQAILEKKPMQYLYHQDDEYYLMDMDTFEQITVLQAKIGVQSKYLKENTDVQVVLHRDDIIGVNVADFAELEVVETDPGVRGDTASGGSKPATLEGGAVVQVPFFINQGDRVKVDTRTDTYLERVK
jgi:elongation factor P